MKKCLLNNIRLFFLLQEVEPCLGFGLTGLEALSAGIPILVSLKLGSGEALMKIPLVCSVRSVHSLNIPTVLLHYVSFFVSEHPIF